MSARQSLMSKNLAKPQGFFGNFVGQYLALNNYKVNMCAIHMLNVQENDEILEIGFGPGIAIQDMAKRALQGYIAGVDYSELMCMQARKRNAKAVKEGRVDLRVANVTDLPEFDTTFDKVIAINNIMYWDETVPALRGLRKVLKPGGIMFAILQRNEDMVHQGYCNNEVEQYTQCFRQAGFYDVRVVTQLITVGVKADKPSDVVDSFLGKKQLEPLNIYVIGIVGINPDINQVLSDYLAKQCSYIRSRRLILQDASYLLPESILKCGINT